MRIRYRVSTRGLGWAAAGPAKDGADSVGELRELRHLLLSGRLRPRDLVDAGHGWLAFSKSPLFADICDELSARTARRRRTWLWLAAAVALGAGLLGLPAARAMDDWYFCHRFPASSLCENR